MKKRTCEARLTAYEEKVSREQKTNSNKPESSYNDSIAELISATVNQAIIDALSPPKVICTTHPRSIREFGYKELQESVIKKSAIEFIESQDLDDYIAVIKKLGRSGANSRMIRRLCRQYVKDGKFLYISQSAAQIMTDPEWRAFQSENISKHRASRKARKDQMLALGNSDAEIIEVPLLNDRLAA